MRHTLVTLAVLLFLSVTFFGQSHRNPKVEQEIRDKLAAVAPGAVDAFQRATAAMDSHNYAQAVLLFREVLQQAPEFTPAIRRLGASLAATGQIEEGISECRKAVALERSPENLANLAEALAFPGPNKEGSETQREEAFHLAQEASTKNMRPEDGSYLLLEAQLAVGLSHMEEFHQATDTLVKKHPELMATHYFHAIQLAIDEKWKASESEIKTAERMGLPREAGDRFLASGVHTRALAWRWSRIGAYVMAAWALGLLALFVGGKIFSRLTLHFIETADPTASPSSTEVLVRRWYRHLINIAGSYYYISLPFVVVLVLGVAGGIVYGFLMLGRIPIKLVLILVIGAIVTVYKMVHSLFVRVPSQDPGRNLGLEEAPGVWHLTQEVAGRLGTRPLDEIRITPGTEMAVYERGTRSERRHDTGKRILIMGLGLLPGFSQNSFRAILAHEYGHLTHRHTAGGDVALRVNQDMMKSAIAMARAGQAVWWNVGFQFLRLYHFLFRRISYGATRLQEVLADRAAAGLYGAAAFEDGLRHVVRRQIEFGHIATKEVEEILKSGRPIQNLYSLASEQDQSVEEAIQQAISRETSEDDTHPSPNDRFRLVSRVPCPSAQSSAGVMWDLFADQNALMQEMSSQVESRVKTSMASEPAYAG